MSALTSDVELGAEQAAAISGEVILQDDELLVAFDSASGALTRMEYKATQWMLERRAALGASIPAARPHTRPPRQLCSRPKAKGR